MTNQKRNDPCRCGSGKKFKKCCLIQQEQERFEAMQEKEAKRQGKPTMAQAVTMLNQYTQQRCVQHNATVQHLNDVILCLEALPASEKRDFVKADMERRLNEMVGDGKGRNALVTQALNQLMGQFSEPEALEADNPQEPASEENEDETLSQTEVPKEAQETEQKESGEVSQETEQEEAQSVPEDNDEREIDIPTGDTGDSEVEDEIDEIIEDEEQGDANPESVEQVEQGSKTEESKE